MSYTDSQQAQLLSLARKSIAQGLVDGRVLSLDTKNYDVSLRALGCCFVTLRKSGELRGCIGSLSPTLPLIEDVVGHAFSAAFEDPRFPKLAQGELSLLEIEISVLSPQVEIAFNSEDELLDQLNPFQDGLSLEDGYRHSTFLPSVWDVIPDKKTFLMKLKQKAGLSPTHWSDTLKAFRYQTISMHEKLE